jgi:hypothetical protein
MSKEISIIKKIGKTYHKIILQLSTYNQYVTCRKSFANTLLNSDFPENCIEVILTDFVILNPLIISEIFRKYFPNVEIVDVSNSELTDTYNHLKFMMRNDTNGHYFDCNRFNILILYQNISYQSTGCCENFINLIVKNSQCITCGDEYGLKYKRCQICDTVICKKCYDKRFISNCVYCNEACGYLASVTFIKKNNNKSSSSVSSNLSTSCGNDDVKI